MSSQLEKLKSSIKKEYVDKFEYDLMKTSGFIPVDKRQNNFYVIINKRNAQNRDSIVESIRSTLGDIVPQFIPVEASDFDSIFNQLEVLEKPQESELSAEQAKCRKRLYADIPSASRRNYKRYFENRGKTPLKKIFGRGTQYKCHHR